MHILMKHVYKEPYDWLWTLLIPRAAFGASAKRAVLAFFTRS